MDNRAPACQRANSNRSGWPALAGLLKATSWHSTCPLGWGLLMGDRGATLCRARSQDSWPSARRVTERGKPRDHFHGIAAETKAASSEVRYPDKHHSSGPSIQTPWPHQTASLVMPLSSAQAGSSQRKTEWPKSFTELSQEGMRNSNQPRKGRAFLDSFSSTRPWPWSSWEAAWKVSQTQFPNRSRPARRLWALNLQMQHRSSRAGLQIQHHPCGEVASSVQVASQPETGPLLFLPPLTSDTKLTCSPSKISSSCCPTQVILHTKDLQSFLIPHFCYLKKSSIHMP